MIAIVTGASAGFGKAIAETLLAKGHKVIITGRRAERLADIQAQYPETCYPLAFDITDEAATLAAIDSLPDDWKAIDLLVNNAGLALGIGSAQESSLTDWKKMIDTNVTGLVTITHSLLPDMVKRNQGYIINLGSIAGNYAYPGGNVYGGTKAFVKMFSLNLRSDLVGTKIRVTNIEPGLCGGTEFSNVRFHGDDEKAAALYDNVEYLSAQDIANTVLWLVESPAHVNINRIELMPVAQASAGLQVIKD